MSDTRKKILITGGSGLIGRALTAELVEAGYEAIVLSRSPQKVDGLPAGARAAGWDGETADGWSDLLEGALGIVHLAGEGIADDRWTEDKKRRIRDSRVQSSRAVLAACERVETKPQFLLQGSAVGYYGARGDERLTEEAAPGEGFLPEVCVEWEEATAPVEAMGIRRAILRTGMVLSRDGGALPKLLLPFRLGMGGPAGDGDQWVPWIHLDDEVAAIRFLAETAEARGPFNLTAPEPVTNREMSSALGRALHRPSLLRAPSFALRLAFGEMSQVILDGQRAVPEALLALGFRFRFSDIEAAFRDLVD